MNLRNIFSMALGINEPWYITEVRFDPKQKRLDIDLDFTKGSKFAVNGTGSFGAYDTVKKSWRHLNFFEHECYLNARVPRVKDEDGTLHTVSPGWSGLSNGFTLLLLKPRYISVYLNGLTPKTSSFFSTASKRDCIYPNQ